jgi:hypothetical protein
MSAKGPKPPASGNYQVGYGKPPVHTRFRKGQSGNPRGSTPRTKPWDRANQLMLKEAYRPVMVRDGERTVPMPAIAAIFRSQLASGLKGNGPAQRASLRMIEAIESDFEAKKTEFLKVVIDYKADAEREIERRRKLGVTDISDIDPHPDDLLVDMATGEVHVKDELNPKDSRMLKGLAILYLTCPSRKRRIVHCINCAN